MIAAAAAGAGGAALCAFLLTSAGCWETRRGDEPRVTARGAGGPPRLALEDDAVDVADATDDGLVRALVDQLVAWRLQHAGLTIDSPGLSSMLLANSSAGAEKYGDDEDEVDAAAGGKVGESGLSGTAAAAPCFLWSRQHISDDEDPVFFDLDMAGDDEDIPVEEVFYNAGDDAYLDDANDIG